MIISFNEDFPGKSERALQATLKAHYALDIAIFLDGERINGIVSFDIVEGRITRFMKDADGNPQTFAGKPVTETLCGKVTVQLVDTGEVPQFP